MLSSSDLRDALPDPVEIVKELDSYVIGQTEAKKALATMLLNRGILKLFRAKKIAMRQEPQKSNVLMIGPTGTGKTALLRALQEVSGIPITIYDVTQITSAGYIGGKVEDILLEHVNKCKQYVTTKYVEASISFHPWTTNELTLNQRECWETGIIYLDEIDKLCSKESHGADVSGDLVQNELLKLLENGLVNMDSHKKSLPTGVEAVKTDNIFFICGGAFSHLSSIVSKRLSKQSGIGFNATLLSNLKPDDIIKQVTYEDLHNYGFKAEFLGRIPVRTTLNALDKDTLVKIINMPEHSIRGSYEDVFSLFGVQLIFEKDADAEIAEYAIKLGMGARSLKSIFETILSQQMFDIFSCTEEKVIITKDMVRERCQL